MSSAQWLATREAVGETARRFTEQLESVRDPGAGAVGKWSISDAAAHVYEVSIVNSLLVTGDQPPDELRALHEMATTVTLDRVGDLNALALTLLPERSHTALASLIARQVASLLDATAESDGSERIRWLGGVKVPIKAVFGHMLSELFVHGYDIAGADGHSFPLAASHARLIFEVFLIELLASPDIAQFAGDRAPVGRPVTCELRLWGAKPVLLVARDGVLTVEMAGDRPVDVRVSGDPAAVWLTMCHRIAPLRALLSRSVTVSGRRPWRLRRLEQALGTP
jgi:hypothetical protein